MTIELTEAQRQALQGDRGSPVDVVDPATKEHYVLLARAVFERVQSFLNSTAMGESERLSRERGDEVPVVSASIRRSQESFWRELPELLKDPQKQGQWVCYHRDERIGIGSYE